MSHSLDENASYGFSNTLGFNVFPNSMKYAVSNEAVRRMHEPQAITDGNGEEGAGAGADNLAAMLHTPETWQRDFKDYDAPLYFGSEERTCQHAPASSILNAPSSCTLKARFAADGPGGPLFLLAALGGSGHTFTALLVVVICSACCCFVKRGSPST